MTAKTTMMMTTTLMVITTKIIYMRPYAPLGPEGLMIWMMMIRTCVMCHLVYLPLIISTGI